MNISFEALLQKPIDIVTGRLYFIKENNEINIYLGKSDKTLQFIGQHLGDKEILPIELRNKSVMEMFNYLFHYANNGKQLVANVVGETDLATKSFIEISNSLLKDKELIATAISNKGVNSQPNNTFKEFSMQINNIIHNPKIMNTKLNVIAPFEKTITLNNIPNITTFCTNVLEHSPGTTNVVHYKCDFNNTDKANFEDIPSIIYDGHMTQQSKIIEIDNINGEIIDGIQEKIYHIDLTDFNKINEIREINNQDITKIKIYGTNKPKLIKAKDDILLNDVENITKINFAGNITGNSKIFLLYSLDSGITWNGYKQLTKQSFVIDIDNLDDIYNKGINVNELNNLTIVDLDIIRKNSSKIRFAYFFYHDNYIDDIYNDSISLLIDMKGTTIHSKNYDYKLNGDNTVTYTITKNGTYIVLWVEQ